MKNPFLEPTDAECCPVDFYLINQQPTPEEEAHLSKLIQLSKNKYKGSQRKNLLFAR
jgi:hypothetical protein